MSNTPEKLLRTTRNITPPMRMLVTASSATTRAISRVRSVQLRSMVQRAAYSADFSMYPAPRTVWIIGLRPASILRRR